MTSQLADRQAHKTGKEAALMEMWVIASGASLVRLIWNHFPALPPCALVRSCTYLNKKIFLMWFILVWDAWSEWVCSEPDCGITGTLTRDRDCINGDVSACEAEYPGEFAIDSDSGFTPCPGFEEKLT